MEILSNLVWVIVALALWAAWLAGRRGIRSASLGFGTGAQLTALAILSVILLPVISVSDDLQASHNPAEVERSCIRSDQHLPVPDAPPPAPAALAGVITCPLFDTQRPIGFLCQTAFPCREHAGHARSLASRSPPAA